MRHFSLAIPVIAACLATQAVAQVGTPANPDLGTSVLAPRLAEPLPAPTPVAPENVIQPVPPPALDPSSAAAAPSPAPAPAPAPLPDSGGVTAVPLPPPGMRPPPPIASGPAPLAAPISLAPPRGTPSAPTPPAVKVPPAALNANKLPEPALSPDASPSDFLRAARGALAAGRNGEARSALEMAQTRLLDRVEDAGKEQVPSTNVAVKQIAEAIDALVANNRMNCLRYIEFASQTLGVPLD